MCVLVHSFQDKIDKIMHLQVYRKADIGKSASIRERKSEDYFHFTYFFLQLTRNCIDSFLWNISFQLFSSVIRFEQREEKKYLALQYV